MMKICIGGLSGSGKTTLGELLAEELGVEHITKTQTNTYAEMMQDVREGLTRGLSRNELSNPKYIRKFDREIVARARGKNCVITTWLSPWMVKDATLRVWLNASFEERAKRIAKRAGMSIAKARRKIAMKDRIAIGDFRKTYGIDVYDHSIFDIELNTERLDSKASIAVISMLAMLKENNRNKW
jgi:predicted cytidylate kinase